MSDRFSDMDTATTSPSSSLVEGKLMLGALLVLLFIILSILALHVYSRFFWRGRHRRLRRGLQFVATDARPPLSGRLGMASSAIDSLPAFVFEGGGPGILECAVCLEEFEVGQKGRALPACGHRFHTECIDMWLFSHSSCPLCRTSVEDQELPDVIMSPGPALSPHLAIEMLPRLRVLPPEVAPPTTIPAIRRPLIRSRHSGSYHSENRQFNEHSYHVGTTSTSCSSSSNSGEGGEAPPTLRTFKSLK